MTAEAPAAVGPLDQVWSSGSWGHLQSIWASGFSLALESGNRQKATPRRTPSNLEAAPQNPYVASGRMKLVHFCGSV